MQTNSSALRCCGEEEEEESGLSPAGQRRPPYSRGVPICPLGPVGGMNLDRVVGRWELAAAARVSVGPSDKTRPSQATARRAGGRAARLDGGGGARVWPPGSPSQLVYVRVLRLTI